MSDNNTNIVGTLLSFFTSKEFLVAVIGGAIGTYFAPWTKWKFEKEKIQIENRKEKIRQWRTEIDKCKEFATFRHTATFHDLKSQFTEEEIRGFKANPLATIVLNSNGTPSGLDPDKLKLDKFHEAVSKIEKEWKIV